MCEFCKDEKIKSRYDIACSYSFTQKRVILGNFRSMTIKFEEMNPLKTLDIRRLEISFCPMCGRDLMEEESTIEMKPVIHAHAIIDWLGNCKCSNCGNIDLNSTEPYCQHCGANLDEPEERED